MSPTLVPAEICGMIVENVTIVADLLSLSLCTSAFRHESQRKLFMHPKFGDTHAQSRQDKFIKSIISSPARLGPLVHIYKHQYHEDTSHKLEWATGRAYNDATVALRAMSNLRQLALRTHLYNPFRRLRSLLHACTSNLEVFCWYHSGKFDRETPDIVVDFLSGQSRLEHLHIHASMWHPTLLRICPVLQSLEVNDKTLLMQFSCREKPITRVQWGSFGTPFLTLQQHSQLEHLELYLNEHSQVSLVGGQLTSLLWLDILVDDRDFLKHVGNFHTDRIITDLLIPTQQAAFIEGIPSLRVLIIRIRMSEMSESRFTGSLEPFLQRIFGQCKTLERIDIQKKPILFERYFSPKEPGDFDHRTVHKDEVYSWSRYHTFR